MQEEKKKFTVFELQAVSSVLSRGFPRGFPIKDLRVLNSISSGIKCSLPEMPQHPEKPKDNTPENMEKYQKDLENWDGKMQEWHDTEVDFKFNDIQLGLTKMLLKSHTGFKNDEYVRERIISLADKLGI